MKLKLLKIITPSGVPGPSGPGAKDNLNNKKLILKNILLEINIKRINNIKTIYNNNNIVCSAHQGGTGAVGDINNKNNKLQHLNNINTWNLQIYNYNKNIEINNTINDKLITKLLYKIITLRLNNNKTNKIIISKPINQHSLNKLNIKFYYYINNNNNNNDINNNNNYYITIINKLINIINNNINNSLSNILSYYYNKRVTIEPIKLSYIYINSDIFSKYISLNDIDKYNNGIITNYQRILNNIIPKLNDHNISINYINNINNINNIKYNNIITPYGINNNINKLYNNINIDNIPIDILIFKYLVGWSIKLKGRLSNNIGRTSTLILLNGTFNNKKYLWSNINNNYKLNYISSNHNLYNNSNINKNGKYNIKVKLNFI